MSKRKTYSREYKIGNIQMIEKKRYDNAGGIGDIENKRRNAGEVA